MLRTPLRIVAVAVALAALIAPAAAQASHTQAMTFEAPRDLLDPARMPGALDQISSLGAHQLRVILTWKNVAPAARSKRRPKLDMTDPAVYHWGQYDALLAAAKQRGWPVLLTVSGPVPKWATKRKRDYVSYPSPKEFQAFMTAVGRHYGSEVSIWSVWNEPNHPDFLMPQFDKRHRPLSGRTYRRLFLAAWRGLRATGNGRAPLLMGDTAPVGTGKVVSPLAFLRQALCLNAHYVKARGCSNLPADGYAHHAYSTRQGPFFVPPNRDDVTIGALSRLSRALNLAARAGAIRRNMGIYVDEFGVQSYPDHLLGVPLRQQSEFYAISEKIAYDNPRVKLFSQYLLRDDPKDIHRHGGGSLAHSAFPGFESGVEFANGRRKPFYEGYRLPLAVTKTRHGVTFWGKVRPATAATSVVLQQRVGRGGWRRLKAIRTDAAGYFASRGTNRRGRTWRVVWTAPGGTTYHGPPIRAYPAP